MRILHLVNHCRHGHGNVHLAVDLACIQARNGNHVAYASEGGELLDLLAGAGVEHVHLRQQTKNPIEVLRATIRLHRLIRIGDFDIVHAHMMSGAVVGYLATRVARARLVTTVHNSFDWHSHLMRLGDGVVAVSEAERDDLLQRKFPGATTRTIRNATLGGERERTMPKQERLFLARPSITTVCGLHERKGVDTLIGAFAMIARSHNASLNIVGDGPDRAALEKAAMDTGFGDRIRFHGSLEDPQSVLSETDIFVLASKAEPMGLVNIEARHAGCAVIASNVGGIPEALDGGAAGILVPADDRRAFADAMTRLLDDPIDLAAMKARSKVGLERFSINMLYREHEALYQQLMQ